MTAGAPLLHIPQHSGCPGLATETWDSMTLSRNTPDKRPSQLRSAVMTEPPRFQSRYRLEDLFSFGIDVSVTAEMSVQKAEGTRFAL